MLDNAGLSDQWIQEHPSALWVPTASLPSADEVFRYQNSPVSSHPTLTPAQEPGLKYWHTAQGLVFPTTQLFWSKKKYQDLFKFYKTWDKKTDLANILYLKIIFVLFFALSSGHKSLTLLLMQYSPGFRNIIVVCDPCDRASDVSLGWLN